MPIERSGYAVRRRSGSTRASRKARAQTLAEESRCCYCGGLPTPDDPLVAAHVIAAGDGGLDDVRANYRAAHASCNLTRGRL